MTDMAKRKIIQVAVTQDATSDPMISVVALCDDGTVWRTALNHGWSEWKPLPPVPQAAKRPA